MSQYFKLSFSFIFPKSQLFSFSLNFDTCPYFDKKYGGVKISITWIFQFIIRILMDVRMVLYIVMDAKFIYDCGIKRGLWQKYLFIELITHNYVLRDQKMVQAAKVWFQMIYSIQEKLCDARSRGDSIFGQKVVFFSWCSNLFQRECSVLETIWNLRKNDSFFQAKIP